jgi:hypothetical protein
LLFWDFALFCSQKLNFLIDLSIVKYFVFCYKAKCKGKKQKKKRGQNYSLMKRVPVASALRRFSTPAGGEAWISNSSFEEAPSFARKFAHWLPSRRV